MVLLLKETMLMNKVEFYQKNVFFLVSPGTYWSACYVFVMQVYYARRKDQNYS